MMATFDSMSSSMTESMTANFIDPVNKQPLKRLEPTIQRFTKIALPTDLGRLSQHKKMIKRVSINQVLECQSNMWVKFIY